MANKLANGAIWDLTAGGIPSQEDQAKVKAFRRAPTGVFAAFPGSTPKYATNTGEIETDFRETMARMFMQVTDYKDFKGTYFSDQPVQRIAEVLAGETTEQTGTSGGNGYIDFLLQSVQHGLSEKSQVVETLADSHVAYFFGEAAPVFAYSGILLNTKQDDQAMNMLRLYRNFGRGSRLAINKTLISIRYDGLIVSGAMMNLSWSLSAETETALPFSFNLLVKDIVTLPNPPSGLVLLNQQFAAGSVDNPGGFKPFGQGALDVGTKPTSPIAATAAPVVPSGSKTSEPVKPATDLTYTQQLANTEATTAAAKQAKSNNLVLAAADATVFTPRLTAGTGISQIPIVGPVLVGVGVSVLRLVLNKL